MGYNSKKAYYQKKLFLYTLFVRVCPCVICRREILFVHDIALNKWIICVAGRDVMLPQLLSEKFNQTVWLHKNG